MNKVDAEGRIIWAPDMAALSVFMEKVEQWRVAISEHLRVFGYLPMATIDFETRSACDLKRQGSWIYSKHETTRAMCLVYSIPGAPKRGLWHMAHPSCGIEETPPPEDLFAFILAGGLLEAHNAFFERVIWTHVMAVQRHWPLVPVDQWRCSASRASAACLPRDLGGAVQAMGLPRDKEKDKEGATLMRKLAKPRKLSKKALKALQQEQDAIMRERIEKACRQNEVEELGLEDELGLDDEDDALDTPLEPTLPIAQYQWHEDPEDLHRLWAYCDQDVVAEMALSAVLPELTPRELAIWQADQELNWAGVRFDLTLARTALAMAAQWRSVLNQELYEMTGITSATQRAAIRVWLLENEGLDLPDTAAATLDWYIARVEMSGRAIRILEIVKQVNRTSIRKFQAMLDRVDPQDGRARDLLMYCGAGTGRWTGKGIQVQNFPRGKSVNAWDKKDRGYFDMDRGVELVLSGDAEWASMCAGDVMELLSTCLRGAIIAPDNGMLAVADYAAIEARVVLWLAGAKKALEVFLRGEDIYCDMATGIYGRKITKKDDPNERQFGKQAILGLGFGMGFITFLLTCRKYDIFFSVEQVQDILKGEYDKYYRWVENYLFPKKRDDEELAKFKARALAATQARRKLEEKREQPSKIIHELALMKFTVDVYRTRYPEVKELWKAQEDAAIGAVRSWVLAVAAEKSLDLGLDGEFNSDTVKGKTVAAGKVSWRVEGGFLCCRMPCGRDMRYRSPRLSRQKTSWGEIRDGLRYMSVVTGGKWASTSTYGGKLVENIVQGVARDIMADAILRTRGTAFHVRMSVHDELLAEVFDVDYVEIKEYEALMAKTEPWAAGCPIDAEGKAFIRYRK